MMSFEDLRKPWAQLQASTKYRRAFDQFQRAQDRHKLLTGKYYSGRRGYRLNSQGRQCQELITQVLSTIVAGQDPRQVSRMVSTAGKTWWRKPPFKNDRNCVAIEIMIGSKAACLITQHILDGAAEISSDLDVGQMIVTGLADRIHESISEVSRAAHPFSPFMWVGKTFWPLDPLMEFAELESFLEDLRQRDWILHSFEPGSILRDVRGNGKIVVEIDIAGRDKSILAGVKMWLELARDLTGIRSATTRGGPRGPRKVTARKAEEIIRTITEGGVSPTEYGRQHWDALRGENSGMLDDYKGRKPESKPDIKDTGVMSLLKRLMKEGRE